MADKEPSGYWREDIRITFEQWNAANTVASVLAVIVLLAAFLGLIGQGWPQAVALALGIGLLVWIPLLLLVITPVRIWKNDRETIGRLREELRAEREQNSPNLVGTIESVMSGHPGPNSPLRMILVITIVNRGAPSFADQWTVSGLLNGSRLTFPMLALPAFMDLPNQQQGGHLRVTPQDAIYEKAIQPIARGGKIRGYLLADLTGFSSEQLHRDGNLIEVVFHDFMGRESKAISEPLKTNPQDQLMYFPGASKFQPSPHGKRKKRG